MTQNTDSTDNRNNRNDATLLFSGQSPDARPRADKGVLCGAVLTAAWLFFACEWAVSSGWWDARLDLTPAEYLSFAAGLLSPVAFVWVAVLYFSSQREYVRQAGLLRAYVSELTAPGDGDRERVKNLLDDIRGQAADLNNVQKLLEQSARNVEKTLSARIGELTGVARMLDGGVDENAEKIAKRTRDLKELSDLTEDRVRRGAEAMEANLDAVGRAGSLTQSVLSDLTAALRDGARVLQTTGDDLKDKTMNLSAEIARQSAVLNTAAQNVCDGFDRQTATIEAVLSRRAAEIVKAGTDVAGSLAEQSAAVSREFSEQSTLLATAGGEIGDAVTAMSDDLNRQTALLRDAADTARANAESMLERLENRLTALRDVFDRQNAVIADKDARLTQTSEKLLETFQQQNTLLDREAEKIVARFKTIETSMDTCVSEINTVSDTAIERLSDVSAALDGKADVISKTGAQVCADISALDESVVTQIEAFANAADNVKNNAKSVTESLTESLTEQSRRVDATLNAAESRLTALRETFADGIDQIKSTIADAEEKSDAACRKIRKQTDELSDLTGALSSQAMVTEASLAQQQKYISAAAQKLEETKAGLKEQSDGLISISETMAARADETVSALSKALQGTLVESGKVSEELGRIESVLSAKTGALDLAARHTVDVAAALRDGLERHKALLDDATLKITACADEIGARISRGTTQMDVSGEAMKSRSEQMISLLETQIATFTQNIGAVLETAKSASAELTQSSELANDMFSRQSATIGAVSDKLAEQSAQTATLLREQSEQADKDLERLISRVRLIEEGLSVQTKELANASEMMVSQLETVGTALTRQTESLTAAGDAAKAKISETGSLLTQTANDLSACVQDACARHTAAASALENKQKEFKNSADDMMKRFAQLQGEIEEQTEGLQKQSAKSTQQAITIRDSMQRHIIDLGDVANLVATQSRMGEAALGNQINYLKEAADDVMTHIRNINDAVRQNTNDLLTASSRIGFELDAIGENMRQRNDEANKTAGECLTRTQNAARELEERSKQLTDIAARAVGELNDAGETVAARTQQLQSAGDTARGQLESAGEKFLVQAHQVNRLSDDAQKALKNIGVVIRERAVDLGKVAGDAGTRVNALSAIVDKVGKEFEEMSNKGVIQIDLAGQRLRSMISEVAGNSERIAGEVRKSGEQFVEQSDLLSIAADDALKRLQELLSLMRDNAKEIQDSGEKISAQSIKLGGAFNRQVQALISASRSAEDYIAALDKKKEDADVDRFMRDASFVVEKLQSLGVDMARLFTPNVEDDLWKRYYSGDHGAFVRHLSRAIDKNQVRKLTELFTENAEFRENVARYVSEFDGILARARDSDRADVLTGILLGSEAGRLYMVLARVFNKEV